MTSHYPHPLRSAHLLRLLQLLSAHEAANAVAHLAAVAPLLVL